MWPLICERRELLGAVAVKRLCENTLPELTTQLSGSRRRKVVAIELFKLL